jgi:FixJ family two-component response regulator
LLLDHWTKVSLVGASRRTNVARKMPTDTSLIAVVDDEECVRKALARLVRSAGFEVETFSSGTDFLLSLRQRRPHCVVLDHRMPQVSGFDVQQEMKVLDAAVPVVVVTGDYSPEGRARAFELGAAAYLRKPVDDATLLAEIKAAVRDRSPPRPGANRA